MDTKNYKILIIVLSLALSSCVKDKPDSQNWNYSKLDSGSVYIVCEGGFTNYDVSLYAYEPIKDSVYGDLFFKPIFLCLCRLGSKALRKTLFYQGFKLGIAASAARGGVSVT